MGSSRPYEGGPMKALHRFMTLALLNFTTACGDSQPAAPPLQQPFSICSDLAMSDEFLVHWKSGKVTLEFANDKETFKKKFLKNNLDQIIRAEPNYFIPAVEFDLSNENMCDKEAGNWGIQSINAPQMWEQGVRGQGIIVAIIDSGIDPHHPQLKDNLFVNEGERGVDDEGLNKAYNGVDDDNNGYIDDISGYDFLNMSPYPIDNFGHGTHVSGTVSAKHNEENPDAVQGVAPEATILPLKFIDRMGGDVFTAIQAINYAVSMGAKVINASWGGPLCSTTLRDRINDLFNENVLFISAAGNSSQDIDTVPSYPASHNLPSQITVGALGRFEEMADFSNYGNESVHIFAPGQDIISTLPTYFGSMATCSNGTSMAAPFVAGAAALLWSSNHLSSVTDIKQTLLQSISRDNSYQNSTQGRLSF